MRKLLLALLLVTAPLFADQSGIYYNPERDGEGATVFVSGSAFTLFFYTYTDNTSIIPPTVSPWIPPPFVSNQCVNGPIWFMGQGEYDGETASGTFYIGAPFDYPIATDRRLADVVEIGTFLAIRDQEGFDLVITHKQNDVIPSYLSMYSTVFQLWSPLLQINSGNQE